MAAGTSLVMFFLWIFMCLFIIGFHEASAIGCFVCSSINGSDPDCEDTFNNTKPAYYKPDCMAGRKQRSGLFPASQCVKMTAKMVKEPSYTMVIRTCVVDSGGVNTETELGRSNHCGFINWIVYDDADMRGCIVSCDVDGCNGSRALLAPGSRLLPLHVTLAVTAYLLLLER